MKKTALPHPRIASRKQWLSLRKEQLKQEKKLTKQYDQVSASRRRLPMVLVEKSYSFDGPKGKLSLLDLFEGRRQLIVYHFMFDPKWNKGCPGCTGYADSLGDLSMLGERDTSFTLISRAPLPKLKAYKTKKGWSWPWCSSFGSDFNYDYHATLDEKVGPVSYNFRSKAEMIARGVPNQHKGEAHGISVFFRIEDEIYHTYSAYARGVESLNDSYRLLDLTPYGRQEDWEKSPAGWPQKPTYG